MTHLVRRLFDSSSGDEGGELDGLSEPTASQQSAPTKAEQSHLIVWQVTTSHDWKQKTDCCDKARAALQPPHALLEVFNLILLIVLNAWVVDYFVKKKKIQLFLVHVLYSLFFSNLK